MEFNNFVISCNAAKGFTSQIMESSYEEFVKHSLRIGHSPRSLFFLQQYIPAMMNTIPKNSETIAAVSRVAFYSKDEVFVQNTMPWMFGVIKNTTLSLTPTDIDNVEKYFCVALKHLLVRYQQQQQSLDYKYAEKMIRLLINFSSKYTRPVLLYFILALLDDESVIYELLGQPNCVFMNAFEARLTENELYSVRQQKI